MIICTLSRYYFMTLLSLLIETTQSFFVFKNYILINSIVNNEIRNRFKIF